MAGLQRIVLDTNVLLRGILHANSPSGQVLAVCDARLGVPLLSKPVLREYRAILTDTEILARYPQLRLETVERVLARLLYIGDLVRQVRTRFHLPRDPKDAKFIELAITAHATDLVTCDLDLLTLPTGKDDISRRFRRRLPTISVLRPEDFVSRYRK